MTETLTHIEVLDPTLEEIRIDPSPELLSALGSLTIEDKPHEVIDTIRYAQKYYKDNEDIRDIRANLRNEATQRHMLSLIELARVQLGHYNKAPVIPAAAYSPVILGEGPGFGLAQDLKAANYELEPIKDVRGMHVIAHRLVPRSQRQL